MGLVPNAPQNLRLHQIQSETEFVVAWEDSEPIADNVQTLSFRLYLDDGSGNIATLAYNTLDSALSNVARLNNLETGHKYTVTVTEVNEIGESLASDPLILHAGTVPSQIKDFTWYSSTSSSVTVRWNLPESNGGLPLTQFKISYDVGQTGAFVSTDITDTF